MHESINATAKPLRLKNRRFADRLGFAACGIAHVWKSEKSFRTQGAIAAAALGLLLVPRPPLIWWAVVILIVVLVLALEIMNSAIEYLCDRLHPDRCEAIRHVKDAAAGAVLLASVGALAIGFLLLLAVWLR
jgi:undecaprenol kinase